MFQIWGTLVAEPSLAFCFLYSVHFPFLCTYFLLLFNIHPVGESSPPLFHKKRAYVVYLLTCACAPRYIR
jgi:hypothetical protein